MSKLYDISLKCLTLLRDNGKKIALAESCTGGLLAKSITDHSGASDVFECGVVSYSGKIKAELLGVSQSTLGAYGEVSRQTAAEMALGVERISGADFGVGITGIAGPTGATPDKKVGLIYVGISCQGKVETFKLELYDDMTRKARREQTAEFVFSKIIELLA